jgi:hypothetical protein
LLIRNKKTRRGFGIPTRHLTGRRCSRTSMLPFTLTSRGAPCPGRPQNCCQVSKWRLELSISSWRACCDTQKDVCIFNCPLNSNHVSFLYSVMVILVIQHKFLFCGFILRLNNFCVFLLSERERESWRCYRYKKYNSEQRMSKFWKAKFSST